MQPDAWPCLSNCCPSQHDIVYKSRLFFKLDPQVMLNQRSFCLFVMNLNPQVLSNTISKNTTFRLARNNLWALKE